MLVNISPIIHMNTDKESKKTEQPLDWVVKHAAGIDESGHVLDLACGNGRHTRYLLSLGFRVTALDRITGGLSRMVGNNGLRILECDLEDGSAWPLAGESFEGVVVTNYLYRPIFGSLINALSDGGVLIYQTFAIGNAEYGRPHNPDFLLRKNELIETFGPHLDILDFEQGYTDQPSPAIIQRICCRKPMGGD